MANTAGRQPFVTHAGPQFIDTSLWVEALRRGGPPSARAAVARAIEAGLAVINGLVRAELLRGARDEDELRRLARLLEAAVCVPLTPTTLDGAARLGFDLRRASVTIPTIDLIVAAAAITQEALLLHCDRHFELIASHSALQQYRVL